MSLRAYLQSALESLKQRRTATWQQAQVYLDNRDSHGIMDMGAEIQALDRAIKEIETLFEEIPAPRPQRSLLDRLLHW